MINKIKAALQQGQYKNLGLTDKAFEGAAAYLATSITDEAEIETKVNSDEVKALLKSFQSVADEARAKKNNQTPQPSDNGNQPNPNPTPNPEPKPADNPTDMEALLTRLLDAKLQPLTDKINGFEATKAKEAAVAALDKFVSEWDYAKGFPKEAAEAKRIAMKLYAKGGESMTAEELIAEFRGEFDPAVSKKGVTDFTKPFESDGGGGSKDEIDTTKIVDALKARGNWPEAKS